MTDTSSYKKDNVKHGNLFDYYNRKTSTRHLVYELVEAHIAKEPIYVEFTGVGNIMRTGSIGQLKLSFSHLLRANDSTTRADIDKALKSDPFCIRGKIIWEGRPKSLNWSWVYEEINWIRGFKGPTEWVWAKPKTDTSITVTATDKFGRELEVNDLITYLLYGYERGVGATICYGNVTKIESDGTVWAKNIKLSKDATSDDKRILRNDSIIKVTDDLMSQLMLARLKN